MLNRLNNAISRIAIFVKQTLFYLMFTSSVLAETPFQNATDWYVKNFYHKSPDELMYAQVEFDNDTQAILFLFSSAYYDKMVGYYWTVVILKKDKLAAPKTQKKSKWVIPKTQNMDGSISNSSWVSFDPNMAGAAYLPKVKHYGILAHYPKIKGWGFTYLDTNDMTLKVIYFVKPSEVGLTEDELIKLRDAGVLKIHKKAIPY